ncbi:MaoC family dehydratase [Actinomadura sp. HBU206391]|uniref:MaoC family dehydratase n=1 Tax=Actinomadura sp. HBU206391 TaxID=2731692 RepID=UPI001C9D0C56|nr:MaoC/PaaZ C-terminal domain-containing protein [Actinomadura sp. HBU206391]
MGFTVGDVVTFSKTVSESDVYLFAGVTGDLAPNHVDARYMAGTPYGRRIAHGVLVLGYTSTASTRALERAAEHAVSYGYDRVRFTAPVYFGDTVTVRYTTERIDADERKVYSSVLVVNQDDVVCLAATHVLKLIDAIADGEPTR